MRSWAWFFGEQRHLFALSRWPGLGIFSMRTRLVAAWCYFVLEASEFSSGARGVVLFLTGVRGFGFVPLAAL